MKLKFSILFAIVALALLITSCAPPCPEIGKTAPDFTLQNTDGKNISLNEFKGKKVIINFWATWCGPCQAEIPHFQSVHDKLSNKGVVILAIDVKENAPTVISFVKNKAITYPVLIDPDAKVAQKYCLPGALPITLFIDSQGIIKARKVGAFRSEAEIISMLDSL